MTLGEIIARGRAAATSWWFVPAVAVLVVLLLVRAWGAEWRARDAAERRAEAAELREKGLAVAAERTERELRAEAAAAADRSADLAAELARARAAAPGARPAAVVTGTTGPRPAGGPPRPAWPCAPVNPCDLPAPSSPPGGGAAAAPAGPPPSAAGAGCLLADGDQGEVRVDAAALRTPAGNQVVVGAAEAWRLEPAPAARLFGGPLKLEVSAAAGWRAAGWGAGAMVIGGRSGWMVGPSASPPPLAFLGMRLDLVAGAGVGPTGEWAATAVGLVRW